MSYDRALTVFSPDGHLFQVEYAMEAVRKGTTAVGIRGEDSIVIGVERKSTAKLQDPRTVRKIAVLDDSIVLTFSGLTADARILIKKARIECQRQRLTLSDPVSVEFIAKYIASIQQKYTQSGGRRPFGVSTIVAGFDQDGTPQMYETNPAGTYSAWKATSLGRNSKTITEYLEKHYTQEKVANAESTIELAVESLKEVVEGGSGKSIDVAVLKRGEPLRFLKDDDISNLTENSSTAT